MSNSLVVGLAICWVSTIKSSSTGSLSNSSSIKIVFVSLTSGTILSLTGPTNACASSSVSICMLSISVSFTTLSKSFFFLLRASFICCPVSASFSCSYRLPKDFLPAIPRKNKSAIKPVAPPTVASSKAESPIGSLSL